LSKHQIRYYPVDNGDTSLIKLKDGITIITDCKIRKVEDGIFDVKKDLLSNLQKRDEKPYTDLFILSHHDQDHCLNFEKHFYCGNVDDYDEDNDEHKDKIIIDELWVNSYILSDNISENSSAIFLKKEVERRRDLHKNNKSEKDNRGNRLVLVGSDVDDNFKNVPQHYPGREYKSINGNAIDGFSFFIHAPLKQSIIEGNAKSDRNATSIVYQARFYNNNEIVCRAIFGGDADHYRWAKIKGITEEKGNQDALKWDIFLAPHHCSWTFFNDTPYKDKDKNIDNSEPQQTSLDILNYHNQGAWVVASSKEVKDDNDNPPHYPAKKEYVAKVGENKFKNTAKYYSEFKEPILFEIEDNNVKLSRSATLASVSTGTYRPSRAG